MDIQQVLHTQLLSAIDGCNRYIVVLNKYSNNNNNSLKVILLYKFSVSHYTIQQTGRKDFLLADLAVSLRVNVDNVVATVIITAVHQNSMQYVVGWVIGIR